MIDYWRISIDGSLPYQYVYAVCGNCSYHMDLEDKVDLGLTMEVMPAKCEKCGWVPTRFCP